MLEDTAKKALSLLDLTDLTDNCDAAAIEKLCAQAQTPSARPPPSASGRASSRRRAAFSARAMR